MGSCTSSASAPGAQAPPPPKGAEAAPAPASTPQTDTKVNPPSSVPSSSSSAPSATTPTATTRNETATDEDDEAPNSPQNDAPESNNLETYSEKVEDWPLMRYGQLTKQSGSGLMKNWRRRNFTVEKGIVKYYELFINDYPYGEREKGCFALTGYTLVEDPNPREPNQILLQSSENKQFDLLVQADDFKKKTTWITIFRDHISYADKYSVKAPERVAKSDAAFKTSQRF